MSEQSRSVEVPRPEGGTQVARAIPVPRPGAPRRLVRLFLKYIILLVAAFVVLFPFVWMVSSSFKQPDLVFAWPPKLLPTAPTLENFVGAWNGSPFFLFILNSLKIGVLATFGQLLSCSMAAFALARFRFRGRALFFLIAIGTMLMPYQARMVPFFIEMARVGWLNSQLPLWVPSFFAASLFGGGYGIFFLRQFILRIPQDLFDAAKIDGSSYPRVYLTVVLPLSRTALAALAVFVFTWSWNDLSGPILFLNSLEKMTVTLGLSFFMLEAGARYALLMAGAIFTIIPVLALYIPTQRFFIQSIALSGLKG